MFGEHVYRLAMPMNRKEQKIATRARILESAREHFERDGYEAANLRAIGQDAGVTAGTVLLHFSDKLDLLHSALHSDLEEAVEASLRAGVRGRLLTRLTKVVRPFFAYYAARPKLSRVLLGASLLADSPWKERFTGQVQRVHAHVVGIVENAKKEGEVPRDANTNLIGAAFFSFYYFALLAWLQGGIEDPERLFQSLLKQHLPTTHS